MTQLTMEEIPSMPLELEWQPIDPLTLKEGQYVWLLRNNEYTPAIVMVYSSTDVSFMRLGRDWHEPLAEGELVVGVLEVPSL